MNQAQDNTYKNEPGTGSYIEGSLDIHVEDALFCWSNICFFLSPAFQLISTKTIIFIYNENHHWNTGIFVDKNMIENDEKNSILYMFWFA